MGGKGSGGRRIGAGRKRKDNVVSFTHGSRQRAGQVEAPAAVLDVVKCPAGTPNAERAIWALHADDAMRAGTLTDQTARSFVQLVCEPRVVYNRILAELNAVGWTYWKETDAGREPKKHPLITDLQNWHRRVDAGHKAFSLAPLGKPVSEPAAPADPFAEFEARA